MTADQIIQNIKMKTLGPVYVLDGPEPFYIDYLVHIFEKEGLQDDHNDFNVRILYGKDVTWQQVIQEARNSPMFGDRILVILKEAQELKEFNELSFYLENPNPQCTLVIEYKGKKIDTRTKFAKLLAKHANHFHSDVIKDYHLAGWIQNHGKVLNISIDNKIAEMLATYLGNDLKKIDNELQKIKISIPTISKLTEDIIEEYIGISKEFNVFELIDAIFMKNSSKLALILNYITANPKNFNIQAVTGAFYLFLQKIYLCHYIPEGSNDKKYQIWASHRKIANQIKLASIHKIIKTLRIINEKSLGIGAREQTPDALIKDFIVRVNVYL